ncbi:MAG: exo-alpha-sialidase [Gammaproteobacteria bacterium]|nr:exo-alpha-sialidase [Gammaproteobacteria bacterium]MDH4254202.1 exo-alpha-sialidase [Gammaproteobacteria bacterium]MDH5309027.1 exo-alpha-sialidase [Gammaproteobacteria bacterium]
MTRCLPGRAAAVGGALFAVLALPGSAEGAVADRCASGDPGPSVHCGRAPSAAFDLAGRLWVAFEQGGHVWVSRADGDLHEFAEPVRVNDTPETVEVNGENRPKIAFGASGEVYVSWTRKLAGGFNGEIRFSRSVDGGRGFEAARTINDDGLVTGHRFETLFVDERDNVYLTWLDKRDLVAATAAGEGYAGAAVYYTVSTDRGASFVPNRRVADHSCECCRIAAAATDDGDVALFFRSVFGDNVRDHGFAVVGPDRVREPVRRATVDGWRIDACPHHGPAMSRAGGGRFHLAWFTGGDERKGIYYGRYDLPAGSLENVRSVASSASAGHPSLAGSADRPVLAWKEFDGERTAVKAIVSGDGGAHWSPPRTLAATSGASDHPLLVEHDRRVFLSWHTADEGLRIVEVDRPGGRP